MQQRREFLEFVLGATSAAILRSQTRSGDMIYRTLGKHRRARVGDWARRLAHRPSEGRAGGHSHRPHRDRPWHHVPGQLLGLRRRKCRNSDGQGAAGWVPPEGLPNDEVRWPHDEGDRPADRRIAEAPANRRHRPDAVSREHPHGRSGPLLRGRRPARSADRRQKGGQDPVHRIHRAQGPGGAPAHAGDRGAEQVPFRLRPDAAERPGCELPQLSRTRWSQGWWNRGSPCWG